MSITTNRLKIDFNIEAIARDFAFLQFTRQTQSNWLGAAQLDALLGDKYRAHAVMFQYSKFAFAMFKRPIDIYALLAEIRKDPEFEKDSVIEVKPAVLRTDSDNCICEAWLAQTLLNSLSSSRSRFAQFHFSNLTGSLLLIPNLVGKRRDVIDAAKVTINKDFLLCIETVRHQKLISVLANKNIPKSRLNSLPYYTLNESTSTLRRYVGDPFKADRKNTYVPIGIPGQKAGSAFLDFGSLEGFERSRAGVLDRVLDAVQKHLSAYMTFNLTPIVGPQKVELTETIVKNPKQLHTKLDGLEVRIVDLVQDAESFELLKAIKNGLVPYLPNKKLLSTGKRDRAGALNLRIIRNREYYEEAGEPDKYLASTPEVQRQHITIESNSGESPAAIKTIVKELLIKRDIGNQKLSLFDWEKLEAKQTWTFGVQDEQSARMVFMDIEPDGKIAFREINGASLLGYNEYQEYSEHISAAKKSEWKTGLSLDGLVVSGDGHKNLIYRTNEFSLPNLEKLRSLIEEVATNLPVGLQTGKELAAVTREALGRTSENEPIGESLITELENFGDANVPKDIFRRKIKEHLGANSKLAKNLRNFLLKKKGIRLIFPKHKESLDSLFDSSLNIKYFSESGREAHYFVGERRESVQYAFKNACVIRKIVAAEDSDLVFEEVLPTMNVDFVRTGQSTVLPFPFKYLREYLKLQQ